MSGKYLQAPSRGERTLDLGTRILEERDTPRWINLVENLLIPGVSSDNLDLDPLLPWMETVEGRRRLQKVLNFCVGGISRQNTQFKKETKNFDVKYNSPVDYFLRTILRLNGANESTGTNRYSGESRKLVYMTSFSILMQRVTSDEHTSNCDLISSLRSVLLYGPTRTNPPIPGDAGRLRENCVTKNEKNIASLQLKLVVDLIASLEVHATDQMLLTCLCSRFLCEVMTVPLLAWKVWPASYERLLHNESSGDSKENCTSIPRLVAYIRRFINLHADLLSEGRIEDVLNMADVSLTTCPAPAVLCLLANMIQIGKTCEALNGMNTSAFHYNGASEYFNFISILINAAPLGTFSSRMSAVEWVSVGSSSTPIVLSDVVIEQASALLSDSYVRALFTCAIDEDRLNTKIVINAKTDKDEKHEKDLQEIGMSSAALVAAKEAMVDRNRSIWQSSKWAKQLSSLISGSREKKYALNKSTDSQGGGKLMNTSSISRQLANGTGPANRFVTNAVLTSDEYSNRRAKQISEYSVSFLLSLCRVYGTIIARWGGHGKEDLVKRPRMSNDTVKAGKVDAVACAEPCVTALLNVLCFSTSFLTSAWAIIQSYQRVVTDLYDVIDVCKRPAPIRSLTAHQSYARLQHAQYDTVDGNLGALVLLLFITCLSHTLIVTDDIEIHDME